MRIRFLGRRATPTAYARVNDHLAAALARRGHAITGGSDGAPVDAVVLHDLERPVGPLAPHEQAQGARRILIRTWDFGPYPPRWAEVVREHYDQLWVQSEWNRELAIRGGVPAPQVRVVPLGIDPTVLRPDGPIADVEPAGTTFLFVGATVRRKGFDLLDRAYRRAFGSDDDVRLVVKDSARDVFYGGQRLGTADPAGGPPITYLDDELDASALAALYRGADALVLPFRAEGFALPTLEALACGTPVVVPRFGAVLDHCDDESAWFVPARRVNLPVDRAMAYSTLGHEERIVEIDLCEPSVDGLTEQLREVAAADPAARARKGAVGAARAARQTWDAVAAVAEATLR